MPREEAHLNGATMPSPLLPGSSLHLLLKHMARDGTPSPIKSHTMINRLLTELGLATYRGDLSAIGLELLALLDHLADAADIQVACLRACGISLLPPPGEDPDPTQPTFEPRARDP